MPFSNTDYPDIAPRTRARVAAHPTRRHRLPRVALPTITRPSATFCVLDVSEFFGNTSGGVKTYLTEKARYVQQRPWLRQVVVVPSDHDALSESDGVRWYHLRGPAIPWQRPYRAMLAVRALASIVRHERPDVIELGSPLLAPWIINGPARALDCPRVYFHHSHLPRVLAPRGRGEPLGRRAAAALAWRYLRRLSRDCALTLAASTFVADDLIAAGFGNVRRAPLGVDLALFDPRRREQRQAVRQRAGLPSGPLAIYAGRLAREKEVPLLLDAWAVLERRTGVHLAIVGDGPARRGMRERAQVQRLSWLPYEPARERLADLLAAADFYVSPCSVETFGLAALEALASGTPVLSADRGGVAEQVAASGAGALFNSGSARSLAEVAERFLAKNLALLGEKGRAYAQRHHSWTATFDVIFDMYQELARRPC